MTIFFFLVVATGLGTLIYLLLVHGSVPGSVDERLGKLEPPPPNLGQWVADTETKEARDAADRGLQREVRHLKGPTGLLSQQTFIRQVRYKNPESGEIEKVEPEQRIVRKRRKEPAQ